MKQDGALVPELQPKLLKAAVFLNNRLPISSLKNFKLLYKALTGNLLELDYTRRVGCRIYKLVPKRKFLKKYDERVYLRVLVSFEGHFVYRLQDPISRKVKRAKEVLFDKDIRLDTATLELPIQLLSIGANDTAPLALEEVILNTTKNYSNVLYYLEASAVRFEQEKHKRPGNLVLANPFQLMPNYTQTGPIPIQIPQNKLLKDIHHFSIQRQVERVPIVNFTYNSIIGKDSVSIFQALRRSNSKLILEIELEDNTKERITSEPTEETDATVLIA